MISIIVLANLVVPWWCNILSFSVLTVVFHWIFHCGSWAPFSLLHFSSQLSDNLGLSEKLISLLNINFIYFSKIPWRRANAKDSIYPQHGSWMTERKTIPKSNFNFIATRRVFLGCSTFRIKDSLGFSVSLILIMQRSLLALINGFRQCLCSV